MCSSKLNLPLGALIKVRKKMEDIVLTDKDQFPTEEVIFSPIGKSKIFWKSIFQHIQKKHPQNLPDEIH
jgi:hypothetical protein